jgi:4-aminobutyrate aminotransferase
MRMKRKHFSRKKGVPPGPSARRWVERDHEVISHSYTRVYPLVIERAEGNLVYDTDGNCFLDFTSGVGTNPLGHCHPKVLEAINRQAEKFIHLSGTDFYYPSQIRLAERLAAVTPGPGPKQTFLSNSGAEAIEAAIKLARHHTRRRHFIAFHGGFHGRTMGALSLTASKALQRQFFEPLMPGVTHVPFGYCYRCPYNLKYPECDIACVAAIEETVFRRLISPEEVAGIVVEPIQGEGGYVVPPPEYHSRLHELAKEYGILYITDEVQTGMGRTGRMFASEHFGVVPDIIALAKGIASGMPLGATVAPSKIMNWGPGAHATTFGGHPISCETAMVTMDLLLSGIMNNVRMVGNYILDRLDRMQKSHRLIGDVRGKGLMIGIELVRDRETKEMATRERDQVVQKCFEKGLLILGCGPNVVRFIPPLTIGRTEADTALSIVEEVLTEVEKQGRSKKSR